MTRRGPGPARRSAPPSAPDSRVESRLSLLVVAGFGVSAAWSAARRPIGDTFTETDFYGAYAAGARLLQQGVLDPTRYGVVGPGYEVLLALAGFVVPDLFLAARLLSIVAAVTALLAWRAALTSLGGTRLALLAVAFVATNAHFLRHAGAATTDAAALALQSAAVAVLLGGRSVPAAWGAGALAAAAFLTRYSGIFLLPAGLLAIAWARDPERRRRLLGFAAGFVLPVAGWMAFSLARGGRFELHHNVAFEVFARSRGIIWDEYQRTLQPQFHSLADVVARDPAAVAARLLRNLGDHLRQDAGSLLGWPVAAAALLGALVGARDGRLRRVAPVVVAGALAYLVLVPTFYSERYALAVLPAYATLAALFFASPWLAPRVGSRGFPVLALLALLPLLAAVTSAVALERRLSTRLPVEVLEVAPALKTLARPGDRVIARKPHLAWYAGLTTVPFPQLPTVERLGAYARERGARWLWVSWLEVEVRPAFWYLLDTAAVVPGLTPRRVTDRHPGVLYEIGPEFGRTPAWAPDTVRRLYHTARGILRVNPDAVNALLTVAAIEQRRGRLEEAERLLARAAAEAPGNPRVMRLRARVQEQLRGQKSRSIPRPGGR